jgi:hypothetical protein
MNKVTVKREELLKILRQNRDQHRAVFERALEGYRRKAIQILEERLEDARANRRINLAIELIQPMDQTREYDRAIRMLEMHTQEQIELSERDFASYVMDDWGWKGQFTATTSGYLPREER